MFGCLCWSQKRFRRGDLTPLLLPLPAPTLRPSALATPYRPGPLPRDVYVSPSSRPGNLLTKMIKRGSLPTLYGGSGTFISFVRNKTAKVIFKDGIRDEERDGTVSFSGTDRRRGNLCTTATGRREKETVQEIFMYWSSLGTNETIIRSWCIYGGTLHGNVNQLCAFLQVYAKKEWKWISLFRLLLLPYLGSCAIFFFLCLWAASFTVKKDYKVKEQTDKCKRCKLIYIWNVCNIVLN